LHIFQSGDPEFLFRNLFVKLNQLFSKFQRYDKRALISTPFFCSETCGVSATNDKPGESGRLATLPNVHIPDATMKPSVSTGSDFKVSGATSTEWPAKVCFDVALGVDSYAFLPS
jgi:hypothetical protein